MLLEQDGMLLLRLLLPLLRMVLSLVVFMCSMAGTQYDATPKPRDDQEPTCASSLARRSRQS